MGKSQSRQPISEPKDGNYVRFALVGSSGCGKSAFVNAVRGVDEGDEQAASVDIVEKEQQPKEYTYPSNPNVSFCDLPGYGTRSYPDIETYWRKLELENFDRFLIFLSDRVMQPDLAIIQKVQSINTSFFLIRTKIDEDAESMKRTQKDRFKEENLLVEIRDYVLKQTNHLSCAKEDIFIISNYEPHKWDFFPLIQAIMNVMPTPEIDKTSDLTELYLADARTHVKKNGVGGIEEFLKKKLEGAKDAKIRFAITGNSGTGKSAFINAIRGHNDDDDGAAKVGVVEMTKEPTEYQHPENPKISFVDLPGIGTPNFPNLPIYCEKVAFEDYDTFLIFTSTTFTQNDLDLAKKVKSIGKSFFLVRTHIDEACKSFEVGTNETEILEKIRQNCKDNVKDLISSEKEIFLISNHYKDKWDFDRLIEAIGDALPVRQRECLTLSLTNVTRECLKRKAKFLKAQAVAVATISAGAGAIPIPVVGGVIDFVLIRGTVMAYYKQLGLNNTTFEQRALLDKKYSDIIERYQCGSVKEFASNIATKTFGKIIGVEQVSKYIPIIGLVISSSVGFACTLHYLIRCINELEKAAIAVWDNASKRSVQDGSETSGKNSSTH